VGKEEGDPKESVQGQPVEVIHIFSSLAKGGAESRTLELIEWMSSKAKGLHVTVYQVGQAGEMAGRFRDAGSTVITQRFRSPSFWIGLTKRLRLHSTTTLHLHVKRGITRPAVLLPVAAAAGVPTRVVHFRSDGTHAGGSLLARLSESFNYRLIDAFATDIIGVSPAALERGWSSSWRGDPRCRVMLSGLNLSPYTNLAKTEHLRNLVGCGPDDTLMVHVGRDTPVKNRSRAVRILSAVSDRRFHLIFIGRNEQVASSALEELALALGVAGQVHLLGERDDVPQLMADADLTLLTSTHEGLPGVVLESLASGTPVLATDLPGTRFIANKIDNVTVVPLAETDGLWAEEARRLTTPTGRPRRTEIADPLHNSEFDLDRAAGAFLTLWTTRRRRKALPKAHDSALPPD